jgi:hypothetical protein
MSVNEESLFCLYVCVCLSITAVRRAYGLFFILIVETPPGRRFFQTGFQIELRIPRSETFFSQPSNRSLYNLHHL